MSRLTSRLSGVTYVVDSDTLAPTKLTFLTQVVHGRESHAEAEFDCFGRELVFHSLAPQDVRSANSAVACTWQASGAPGRPPTDTMSRRTRRSLRSTPARR